MNTPNHKRAMQGLLSGLLASLLCMTGTAFAQTSELEPNGAASPQLLTIPSAGTLTVTAAADSTTDLDYFVFDTAGGTPNIVFVAPDCMGAGANVNAALFDELGNLLLQQNMASMATFDPTRQTPCDPTLTGTTLVAGRYYVAVSPSPLTFEPGNNPTMALSAASVGRTGKAGPYSFTISGLMPGTPPVAQTDPVPDPVLPDPVVPDPIPVVENDDAVTTVSMEVLIWRGQDREVSKRWKRHIKRMGKRNGIYPIPVVIFSSDTFEASDINPKSLTFGADGDEDSLFRCSRRTRDINRDGREDMVCYFDGYKTGFDVDVLEGNLQGETMDQEPFASRAALKQFSISPDPRETWKKRHDHRQHTKYKKHNKKHYKKHRRHHKHDD